MAKLAPKAWLYKTNFSNAEIIHLMMDYVDNSSKIVSTYRNKFICQRLNKILLEHRTESHDLIDEFIRDPNFIVH